VLMSTVTRFDPAASDGATLKLNGRATSGEPDAGTPSSASPAAGARWKVQTPTCMRLYVLATRRILSYRCCVVSVWNGREPTRLIPVISQSIATNSAVGSSASSASAAGTKVVRVIVEPKSGEAAVALTSGVGRGTDAADEGSPIGEVVPICEAIAACVCVGFADIAPSAL